MEAALRDPGAPAGRKRYARGDRVRRGKEIRRLLREGRREKASDLEIFFAPSSHGRPRFGVVVPRYRNRIVRRNRLRRRLREIGRVEVLPRLREGKRPFDVLVRARPGAYRSSFQDLRNQLVEFSDTLCSRSSR